MGRGSDVSVRTDLVAFGRDDLLSAVSVGRGIAPPLRLGIRDVSYRGDCI